MTRAAFLDRDGVINAKAPEGQYITRWEEVSFLPEVAEAIRMLNENGFLVIVITNQRCVARGLITAGDLEALHQKMCEKLALGGAQIDDIYSCTHEGEPPCSCRKPAPGMILEAARDYEISLSDSWMMGDSESDIQAGIAAGCKTVFVTSGRKLSTFGADLVAQSLLDATRQIVTRERRREEVVHQDC